MPSSQQEYIGRFAPSPTGALHFGSIIAALGSYLDARNHRGKWLLRMDDLDAPRVQAGAGDKILSTLETLGLHWDGSVLYQSQRNDAYKEAEKQLQSKGLLYRCYCSRKLVGGQPYPGTCLQAKLENNRQYAIRVKTETDTYTVPDLIQAEYSQQLHKDVGDFIIKRADNLYAYHLAVVTDDAYQNITHIVRGADLMDSTPRQIYLQQQLNIETPVYAHLPLAITQSGEKICKQYKAADVMLQNQPTNILFSSLQFLGQKPGSELLQAPVDEILQWGVSNWKLSYVPKLANIIAPDIFQSPNH